MCRSRSEEDFLPGSRWNGKQTFLLHWIICFLQSYFISFNLGWSGRIKYISVIYSVELHWSQMLPTMFWHEEVCQFEVVYKSNCVFLSLWLLGEHQMIPQRARTERTWLNVTLIHLNTSWSHSTSSNYVLSLFYSKQETTSGKKMTCCAFNLRQSCIIWCHSAARWRYSNIMCLNKNISKSPGNAQILFFSNIWGLTFLLALCNICTCGKMDAKCSSFFPLGSSPLSINQEKNSWDLTVVTGNQAAIKLWLRLSK